MTASDKNHHSIPKIIADAGEMEISDVELTAIRIYARAVDSTIRTQLVEAIAAKA